MTYLTNWFKGRQLVFLTGVLSICIGCSNPTAYGSDEVTADLEDNGFKVSNNLNTSIYYFAVEQEYAARINWAPSSRQDNEIKAFNKKLIPFSNIPEFKKDDKISFYYWAIDEPSQEDIRGFVISTQD